MAVSLIPEKQKPPDVECQGGDDIERALVFRLPVNISEAHWLLLARRYLVPTAVFAPFDPPDSMSGDALLNAAAEQTWHQGYL